MAGLFQGLEIGKRALLAHQISRQTMAHNIANVNTPGYTRQRVDIRTSIPEDSAVGPIGSGITVREVRQIRDLFLGDQLRQENKSLGKWTFKEKILAQVESIFNEPNDNTLADILNDFWGAWSELSNDPTSTSARKNVIDQANQLANGFRQVKRQLASLQNSISRDMENLTSEINAMSTEIASLNRLIASEEADGTRANDLRDARDLIIDNLSGLIDVNTVEKSSGSVTVYIGAMAIVDGVDVLRVASETDNVNGILETSLIWEGTSIHLRNNNGKLKGMLEITEEIIPRYMQELDSIAAALITEVNTVHSAGFGLDGSTGTNFFNPNFTDASRMEINKMLLQNTDMIAVSGSGAVGDNTIALALHDLRDAKLIANGTSTRNNYYNSLIGTLGVESKESKSSAANYELLVHQIFNSKQSVEGVSLDEEMANMIKFQHAYDAAARIITTMDQALDTVINKMGIVGR